MQDYTQVQHQMEQEALDMGIANYRKMRQQGEADLPPGQRLIRSVVAPLAAAIKAYLDDCAAGVPSRSAGLYYFLQQWADEPELPAYVTARHVVDALATVSLPLQHIAKRVAVTLEDQVNHEALRDKEPRLYRQLLKKIGKSPSPGYRHVVLRKQQKFAGIKAVQWGRNERVRVGALLIELMQQTTGLFEVGRVNAGLNDTPLRVIPTEATLQWLEGSHARCELLSPVRLPMVVKPRPWSNPFNGGYLNKKMRMPLITGAPSSLLEELKQHEMPLVYRAINALQDTAWRVNGTVLRIMREVWDGGGNLGGLPSREPLPLPAKNFSEDAPSDDPRVREWRAQAAEVFEKNIAGKSKRVQMQCKMWVAEKMSAFERIYYPHVLDFRGRAYAIGAYLSPQADDISKSLLHFAEGKPLGEDGAFWLAVHGANCFGVDKVSFDERTAWVTEHFEQIVESADNPLDGSRWWTQADSPWQFLAFCIEWRNLDLWIRTNPGDGMTAEQSYVSRLPVGLDGACNGLQNFSAMLRDEVGGKATNLIPSAQPSDIYAEVAAGSNRIIAEEAAAGNEVAQRWVGKITRALTKRNTMTVPYAVTEFGMREQLVEEFKHMRGAHPSFPVGRRNTGAANAAQREGDPVIQHANLEDAIYLARVNYRAIGEVVIAARAAMDWLREAARVVASDSLPVQWVTPSGFLVVQNYREFVGDALDFTVCGRRYQMMMTREGDKLNRRKQSSGISPNFVHSLDAAHLQRTVGLCLEHGVTDFCMIHDSYGTHAADVGLMSRLLRQAFVEQYSGDVLGDFREQMVKQVPEDLAKAIPPCPPMGTLELTAVMDSDYFFA